MGEGRLSRRQLIARRWIRILSVALLAFAMSFLLGRIGHDKLDDLASVPTWGLLVALGSVGALATAMAPSRLVAALRLKHVRTYPPYWFGATIGIGVGLFVMTHVASVTTAFQLKPDTVATLSYWSGFVSLAPVVWLGLAFVALPFRKRGAENPSIPTVRSEPPDLERLLDWISNDDAVTDPAKDMFGHANVAATIAARIVRGDLAPQAVVGQLGSGKTTIGKLVERYVAEAVPDPPISFIKVELWAYATPRAAVEAILSALMDAFSTEINIAQLKGLPEAYGTAIAKLAGVAEWVPSVLRREPLAEWEVLEAFDDVAIAIRRRFVLWVEDLERFGGGNPDSLPTPTELERLAPIRALLLGLGRLRAISVITASTDLLRRFDIEKIAAYTEPVPSITLTDARRVIASLRRTWLENAKVIDPAASTRRQMGWDEDREENPVVDWLGLGEHVGDFASAVAALAATPRTLKQGLRAAQDIWKRQAGEIDLDDVIALSVLRESHPDVFALVARRIRPLRGEHMRNDREKDPLTKLKEDVAALKHDGRTALALDTVLTNVFGPEGRGRPQGIGRHSHADYWARYLGQESPAKNERDQDVLRALQADDDSAVIELLIKERTATIVEDFARQLSAKRIQGLLPKLADKISGLEIAKWGDRHAPGVVPLWRMIRSRLGSIDLADLERDLEAAMASVAPKNLALLQELVYWFTTSSRELVDILEKPTRERLVARSQSLLLEHYVGKPERLAAQLRGAPAPLLLQACYGLERIRIHRLGKPFEGWSDLAATTVSALSLDPEAIAPQLSAFITREHPNLRGPDQWVFDKEQCEALFGDPNALIARLRESLSGKKIDDRSQAVIDMTTALPKPHQPSGRDEDDPLDGDQVDDDDQLDDDDDVVVDDDNSAAEVDERAGGSAGPSEQVGPSERDFSTPILQELYDLSKNNEEQRAVEVALRYLEAELTAGHFEAVDGLLKANVTLLKPAVLVSILAITIPARDKLENRANFLERTEAFLKGTLGPDRTEIVLAKRR